MTARAAALLASVVVALAVARRRRGLRPGILHLDADLLLGGARRLLGVLGRSGRLLVEGREVDLLLFLRLGFLRGATDDLRFRRHGLGGGREMSSLRLFRRIGFLAPHKRIETFLDSSDAYFARREPTRLRALITYRDGAGRRHERETRHDLSIYRDLAYLTPPADPTSPNCPAASTLKEIRVPVTGGAPHGSTERQTLSRLQFPG